MAMSKKHFIAIAREIKSQVDAYETAQRDALISNSENSSARGALHTFAVSFCDIARGDNPNFDSSRFLAACGF